MTINQVIRAAQLLSKDYGYQKNIDDNGNLFDADAPFDWYAKPIQTANSLRCEIIERIVSGLKVNEDTLSDWAKIELRQWREDAEELITMGVTADAI